MLRTHAIALPLLLVLTLAGCGSPPVALEPEPTPEELAFATEEEALAAAIEVYANYARVADKVGMGGGVSTELLSEVAMGEFLRSSVEGFAPFRVGSWHQVGSVAFRDVVLESSSDSHVSVYLCEDLAGVDVVDPNGATVVSPTRPDTNYFLVRLELDGEVLKVSSRQRWDERQC